MLHVRIAERDISKFSARRRRSRVFGLYIEHYRTKRGISMLHKITSAAFLWAGMLASMIVVQAIWIYITLGIVGTAVTAHLLLIKTKRGQRNGLRRIRTKSSISANSA